MAILVTFVTFVNKCVPDHAGGSRESEKRQIPSERAVLRKSDEVTKWWFCAKVTKVEYLSRRCTEVTFGTTFDTPHDLGAPVLKSLALLRNPASEAPVTKNILVYTARAKVGNVMRRAVIVMEQPRDSRPVGAQGSLLLP